MPRPRLHLRTGPSGRNCPYQSYPRCPKTNQKQGCSREIPRAALRLWVSASSVNLRSSETVKRSDLRTCRSIIGEGNRRATSHSPRRADVGKPDPNGATRARGQGCSVTVIRPNDFIEEEGR